MKWKYQPQAHLVLLAVNLKTGNYNELPSANSTPIIVLKLYFFKKLIYETQLLRTQVAAIPLTKSLRWIINLGGLSYDSVDTDTEHQVWVS